MSAPQNFPEKTMTVEMNEQDSSLIIVALDVLGMKMPPGTQRDRARLPALKQEIAQKHAETFHQGGKPL